MDENNQPLSVGKWILTQIVLAIPCVGLIMLFVWGFGDGNVSRKNYCKAVLIVALIMIVINIGLTIWGVATIGLDGIRQMLEEYLNNIGALTAA